MELRGRRRAKKPQSGFFRRQYDSTVRGKWEGAVRKHRRNPVEKPGYPSRGGSHPPRVAGAGKNHYPFRISVFRNWMASAKCGASMRPAPSRSAMLRATRRMRS